jgi:hypothetical protein
VRHFFFVPDQHNKFVNLGMQLSNSNFSLRSARLWHNVSVVCISVFLTHLLLLPAVHSIADKSNSFTYKILREFANTPLSSFMKIVLIYSSLYHLPYGELLWGFEVQTISHADVFNHSCLQVYVSSNIKAVGCYNSIRTKQHRLLSLHAYN